MGIRSRFVVIMGVLSSLSIVGIGLASYKFSERTALAEAKQKGQIIFSTMLAVQKNFMGAQRPLLLELVEKDRFYPELMSGAVITRMVWEIFEKQSPGLRFKQAALDPRYTPNKADAHEAALIEAFRRDPNLTNREGIVERDGEPFYYCATPRTAAKGCLTCHGDPMTAPKDQLEIYGAEQGYHWKENEIPAAFVVYVPLGEALASAKQNALWLLGIGSGGLLITLVGIGIFLDRSVVAPIVRLSDRTEEISLGTNLDEKITSRAGGEIGTLAQAIERLRVSLAKILKRAS